jgi:hypothetical protein
VGVPYEDFNGSAIVSAGQAVTIYGSAAGFDLGRTQFWTEDLLLGPGHTEPGDSFGLAMAAGDFDGDGTDDLAIGHPGEFDLAVGDGAATVLPGSPAGLSSGSSRLFASGQAGVPGSPHQPDRWFARAIASGDFDADGHTDLVLGAPRESLGEIFAAGAEVVLYGSRFADGFETADAAFWSAIVP